MTIAAEVKASVWMLRITWGISRDRQRTKVEVFRSYDGAMAALHAFVTEWWNREMKGREMPSGRNEAIEWYFDKKCGDEDYEITEYVTRP